MGFDTPRLFPFHWEPRTITQEEVAANVMQFYNYQNYIIGVTRLVLDRLTSTNADVLAGYFEDCEVMEFPKLVNVGPGGYYFQVTAAQGEGRVSFPVLESLVSGIATIRAKVIEWPALQTLTATMLNISIPGGDGSFSFPETLALQISETLNCGDFLNQASIDGILSYLVDHPTALPGSGRRLQLWGTNNSVPSSAGLLDAKTLVVSGVDVYLSYPEWYGYSAAGFAALTGKGKLLYIGAAPEAVLSNSTVTEVWGDITFQNNEDVQELHLTGLEVVGAGFNVADNPALSVIELSALTHCGFVLLFRNNQLSAASVNHILAKLVTANDGQWAGSVQLDGGPNAAPTGQGIIDAATLVSRGANVYTN